jgi:glycosyltransferase involved in cell wall biosynthesis
VIIPTYNRSTTLILTLQSLASQNYPSESYEIIVVDNASTDETKEVVQQAVKEHAGTKIRYIFETRQGVHYARNTGAKESSFEFLYFTDDDVVADRNLLSEIIKPILIDPEVACVTGKVLPIWEVPPPQWVKKHCYNSLLSILDIPEDFIIAPHLNYIYSCHQLVSKSALFRAGGFNPENTLGVWLGDGETGLVIKMENLGCKFGYNGKAVTNHIIPPSRMTQSYLEKRVGNSGNSYAFTYYRKNRPSPAGLNLEIFLLLFVKFPLRTAYYLFKAVVEKDLDYLRFVPAYFRYYYNRSRYNARFAVDPKLRAFALRDNWFEDDGAY